MVDSSPRIAALQRRIARLSRPLGTSESSQATFGLDTIDARIGGGLARGALHEVVAADAADAAAASGFAAMLARRIGGPLVWLRVGGVGGDLYPPGLNEIGIDPAEVLLVLTPDPAALLRAAGEVARCSAVGIAVIELWHEPGRIDLTVSRRLALAAEGAGTVPLLLRIAAAPAPSAARTRWAVCAAPSAPLPGDTTGAPGRPVLDLELVRQRGGPAGWRWRVEWNRETAEFSGSEFRSCVGPPLSGDLVAVPDSGSLDDWRIAAG